MHTYIYEYMQVCISIVTDIHINTNMKMVVCIRRRIHVYISNSVMHVRIRLNIGAIIIKNKNTQQITHVRSKNL